MAMEIERRFLVDVASLPDLAELPTEFIRQGYLSKPSDSLVVRVRAVEDFTAGRAANTGVITIKQFVSPGMNKEFEYFIDYSEAEELLKECSGEVIQKARHFLYIPNSELCWEIDVFRGKFAGIVIAEIELPSLDTELPQLPFTGVEITKVKGVGNYHMAFDPDSVIQTLALL